MTRTGEEERIRGRKERREGRTGLQVLSMGSLGESSSAMRGLTGGAVNRRESRGAGHIRT